MDVDIDHYAVLGLPSGEKGAKLSVQEITTAYRAKALELHPDKCKGPNANAGFIKLKTSYEVLMEEKERKLFDDLLRVKREKLQCQGGQDLKWRKMMSDLEERERAAFAVCSTMKAQEKEKYSRIMKEQVARVMRAKKTTADSSPYKKSPEAKETSPMNGKGNGLDKGKVLQVSWQKIGEDYTEQRLREIFEEFGAVEDVVMDKEKRSAFVVMASKDADVTAIDSLKPQLVVHLQPASSPVFFQAKEDMTLEKLRKAALRQSDLESIVNTEQGR